MNSRFHTIKAELLRIDAAFQGLTEDQIKDTPDKIYYDYLDGLNRLAAAPVEDEVVESLIADPQLRSAIGRISRLKRLNGLRLEAQFAESLIADPDPQAHLEQFVYYPNYVALARMEYGGAGLHAGDRVVFLGSGPLPMTLICLSREYGIEGIGIEQDEGHAILSRRVIRVLGMGQHIQIICGNHFTLPLEDPCSLIMVGADAIPKSEIFGHLAEILQPGQMVSFRIYEKGLRRLFDEGSVFDLPPEVRECARVRPEPPVNNTCVFAVRAT
jgi:hypothetical protein